MAITQAQADKDWQDSPSTTTPIMASDLKGMGRRSRDLRWMVPTGVTSIDEFDDDTLAAAWTRVDGTGAPSGNVSWTEKGDSLSVPNQGGNGTAFNGLVVPLASFGGSVATGDAFVAHCTLLGPTTSPDSIGGIVLSTNNVHGAGQQVVAACRYNASGDQLTNIYDLTSWGAPNAASATLANPRGLPIFVRLVYLGSNSWRADSSPDGTGWIIGTALSKTLTPTHVGFVSSSYTSVTKHVMAYDFLRRVSGVS